MTRAAPATTLRIVIPMAPPPETSPNYHGDWRGRHRAVVQFREATAWAFRQQHPVFPVLQPPIAYRVVIRWGKGRKLHDDDNALAMTKAVRDQMAFDLDLRSDRQMRCVGVRQERDTAGNGETIFEGWSDAGGADNRDNPHDPGGAVDAEPTAPSGRSCPDHQ